MWKRLMLIGFVVAVVLVLVPIVVLATLSLTARRPDNLGAKDGKLAPCPDTPNCVSSQAADAEHRTEPLRFTDSPETAWARLVILMADMPRANVVTVDDAYLHAECRSAVFRFTDDVEFLLDAENQAIHCRSASRVGYGDMGANRQRIEAIRAAWEQASRGR